MKITVNITDDSLSELVVSDLKAYYESMMVDLKNRPKVKYGVFHNNMKKDIAEMKKVTNAVKVVLENYGVEMK